MTRSYGERCPFGCGSGIDPLVKGSDFLTGVFVVRPLMRRFLEPVLAAPFIWTAADKIGLLDLVLARFSTLESDPEPSFSSWMGSGCGDLCRWALAADRVTGAK